MGNNCCLAGRETYRVNFNGPKSNIQSKQAKLEQIPVLNVNEQEMIKINGSCSSNSVNYSIPKHSEILIEEKSRFASADNCLPKHVLQNRIRSIANYRHKPIFNSHQLQINSINSKLTYSLATNDKSSFNQNSKLDERKSLSILQENLNFLKSEKKSNVLIAFISANCWFRIIDFLNLLDLNQAGLSCSAFNRMVSSPSILKKFYTTSNQGILNSESLISEVKKCKSIFSVIKPKLILLNKYANKSVDRVSSDLFTVCKKSSERLDIATLAYEPHITEVTQKNGLLSFKSTHCNSRYFDGIISNLKDTQPSNYTETSRNVIMNGYPFLDGHPFIPSIYREESITKVNAFSGSLVDVSCQLNSLYVSSTYSLSKESVSECNLGTERHEDPIIASLPLSYLSKKKYE